MESKNRLITADNFRDLDWNKAKFFYYIAKCGGFVKAAQITGIDQASLTRQMQVLEKQIGYPLLVRKVGGTTLTRKGEELLKKIAPFFLEMRGFCGDAHVEIRGQKKRKIRIATSHALASYIISDLILDYARDNSHLSFELIGNDHLVDIISNDVDIVVQPIHPKLKGKKIEGVQCEHLFSLQKKLYASESYVNTYGEPQTVQDLINHDIIAFAQPETDPYYRDINWILTLGMPQDELHSPVYVSNSITSLIDAAEKGIGIVASYEHYKILKNSNLKNILPDVKDNPLKEYFIYPDYLKHDNVVRKIKNYLQEKLNS